MSREIPMDKPLSDEDRAYLLERGYDQRVEALDARFPEGTGEESEEDPEETAPYEEWSADDLRAEIDERNEQDGRTNKISKAGSRADMAARLREDDSRASS